MLVAIPDAIIFESDVTILTVSRRNIDVAGLRKTRHGKDMQKLKQKGCETSMAVSSHHFYEGSPAAVFKLI